MAKKRFAEWEKKLGRSVAAAGVCWGLAGCSSIPAKRPPAGEEQIHAYLSEAVELRGLPIKRNIAIEKESVEAMRQSLAQELKKEDNRRFMADSERLLKQFRVLKPDDSLEALFLRVMSQQVAAYYDPEKKRVAYVENAGLNAATNRTVFPGMERFVYVHEFCHAVEDDAFDLDRLMRASQESFDRDLALTSLVEGNAVLVGLDGVFDEVPMNSATPVGGLTVGLMGYLGTDDASLADMKGCPPFLGGALLRPYLDGARFSNRLRREAGWRAIDAVYRSHLPTTTAEILYPEKRFLSDFKPAVFHPAPALFASATGPVVTNSLGAMGMALWLGGEKWVLPRQYGFLRGWLGDRVYLFQDKTGGETAVWLSYWERPSQARAFVRGAEKRFRTSFGKTPWRVNREGHVVAAVWTSAPDGTNACASLVSRALETRAEAETPSLVASWWSDAPWPVAFPSHRGYSDGCEVLGGYVLDACGGDDFFRFTVVGGLGLRVETNPDRHYVGSLWGLLRHVRDERADFTYWRLPVVATWYRRGSGADQRYQWSALWGLLADGDETRARVLFVPVWHSGGKRSAPPVGPADRFAAQ